MLRHEFFCRKSNPIYDSAYGENGQTRILAPYGLQSRYYIFTAKISQLACAYGENKWLTNYSQSLFFLLYRKDQPALMKWNASTLSLFKCNSYENGYFDKDLTSNTSLMKWNTLQTPYNKMACDQKIILFLEVVVFQRFSYDGRTTRSFRIWFGCTCDKTCC